VRRYLILSLLVLPIPAYAVLPYIFANQPAGNVPASYLDTDFSLVEGGIVQSGISTGSANSYSVAPAVPWVGGYSNYANQGLTVNFNAGNTGPSSINVSGLGAANLVKNVAGVATTLASGDINTNVPYLLINDGTQFWVQSVAGSTSSAGGSTTTVQYNNSGVLAGSSGFNYNSTTNVISATGTVQAASISLAGFPVPKCTTSGDFTLSTLPAGIATAFTHGLGVTPTISNVYLRNLTGQLGYTTGDIVEIAGVEGNSAGSGSTYALQQNSTSTTVILGNNLLNIITKSTGGLSTILSPSWAIFVKECAW